MFFPRLIAAGLIGGVTLILSEIGVRLFVADPQYGRDERSLLYRHDPELGWFPKESSHYIFTGSRDISVTHNRMGLRDVEHGPKALPRILFLGDSFVWGYDVEQGERFTEHLQRIIPRFEIINAGVSGYGTDQEYLLLKKIFGELSPELVFVIFCTANDRADNSRNLRYRRYLKPYFTFDEDENLTLRGVPVPPTLNYLRSDYPNLFLSRLFSVTVDMIYERFIARPVRVADPTLPLVGAMNDWVKEKGARLFVGFTDSDPELEDYLTKREIPHLTLSTDLRFEGKGHHWTPQGHAWVAEKIMKFLSDENVPMARRVAGSR